MDPNGFQGLLTITVTSPSAALEMKLAVVLDRQPGLQIQQVGGRDVAAVAVEDGDVGQGPGQVRSRHPDQAGTHLRRRPGILVGQDDALPAQRDPGPSAVVQGVGPQLAQTDQVVVRRRG